MAEKKTIDMKSFITRLISGIVLVVLALITVPMGQTVLLVTVGIISLIGISELYHVFQIHNNALGFVGYIGAIGYYLLLFFERQEWSLILLVGVFFLCMAVYVFAFPKYGTEQVMGAFFGLFYAGVLLSCLYLTREMKDGLYLVWLIFLSSWGCDTCAYCVGILFGKHKMAPVLSPKKSVEGGIGGVIGAGILGLIYGWIFSGQMSEFSNPALECAIVCMVGAMISQVGDLAASAIKRNHGLKDYGKLIPGHGGIMDRFDSIIFTAPMIYYVAMLLQNVI